MSQSVDRLKELLFEPESTALRELRARIDQSTALSQRERAELASRLEALIQRVDATTRRVDAAFERAGSDERLRESVATVLADAMRKADVKEHDRVARAMAPFVVKTVHAELANSKDAMVEALYPITGRLVKAYVASAMKDLADQINRRLENNAVMLRLRSLTSGRSVAELALADSQRLTVDELFLIERGSGALIQHWPPSAETADRNVRLGGILTAINDFASHTLGDSGGSLRSFDLDGYKLYLRGSARYLLAAKCHGTPPPGIETVIDEKFVEMVEELNGWEAARRQVEEMPAEQVLGPFAEALDSTLEHRHQSIVSSLPSSNPLKVLAVTVAIPLIAWMSWNAYDAYAIYDTRNRVRDVLARVPESSGYPIKVDVSAQGRLIQLSGLVPSAETRSRIVDGIRESVPLTTLVEQLTVVAGGDRDAGPELAAMRRALAVDPMRRRIESVRRRLIELDGGLLALETALGEDQRRAVARNVRAKTARAAGELETLLSTDLALTGKAAIAELNLRALGVASDQVEAAAREVAGLMPTGSGSTPAPTAKAADRSAPEAAIEALSAASERLHALTYAAASYLQAVKTAAKNVPVTPPPTAQEQLERLLVRSAVFFSEGTELRAPDLAQRRLSEIARLIREANLAVRVVGYTDEAGSAGRNASLAVARADRVIALLVERGAPRNLLIAVGRTTGPDISSAIGPQSPNRRVEFELGFDGELDGRR